MSDHQALLAKIETRRKEIAVQRSLVADVIATNQSIDDGLQKEDADLEITERYIRQFTEGGLATPVTELAKHIMAERAAPVLKVRGKRKPDGLPSVLEMAAIVFRDRANEGQPWLEPAEIVTEIKRRWWKAAEQEFIGPQLWRAARKGRLLKNGTRYALPIEKAPDSVAAEASHSNGAAV